MASRSADARMVDFAKGIRASQVKEGKAVAGHVGGERVLLVRHDGEIYAISGSCTRCNASLEEGLIIEGEIRCPWHHGCFSLATGAVTAPPALNPLARWRVEREGERLFVRNKYPPKDPLTMRDIPRSQQRNVVIIGAGAAGSAAAESLRINGFKGVITVIDPDMDAPYHRPSLSKGFLAGTASAESVPLRPSGFYAQHGIRRLIDAAASIDAANQSVTLQSGQRMSYDALLLAFGAAAVRPRVPGAFLAHVHVLRTLADCTRLMRDVGPGSKVVIAGASFTGMEAAAALRQRKADVTVVAPELIPFAQILGPTIGASLTELHARQGVKFQLGKKLAAIGESDVMLDDGTVLTAEVVLLATGVQVDSKLPGSAGVESQGGVVVNSYLETSVPRIYAAGDIARYPEARSGQPVRIEHWAVAQRQGQIAACNILGLRKPFTAVPFFSTQQYDVRVSCVGHAADYTHIKVDGSPETGNCSASFMAGQQLLAYVSIGRDHQSLKAESKLERMARNVDWGRVPA